MKSKLNFNSFLVIVMMLLVAQVAFAGYSNNTRTKCRTFAKKYASNSHIFMIGLSIPLCAQHSGDCGYTNVSCQKSGWFGCESYTGATTAAGISTGYCNVCPGFLGANYSSLEKKLLKTGVNDLDYATNKSSILPDFKGNLATISNIKVDLSSYTESLLTNDFNIIVWKPVGESDDETPSKDKIIQSGRVMIKNGKIIIEGTLFKASDFSVVTRGVTTTVTYIGGNKTVALPSNSNEVDYYITMSGDVKDDKAVVREAEEKAESFELSNALKVFPNPTSNTISFTFNTNNSGNLEYEVFDLSGKSVIPNKQHTVDKYSTKTFQLDISKLESGNYYLLIINGEDKIIKSISKI